jgi:hypothetical protein
VQANIFKEVLFSDHPCADSFLLTIYPHVDYLHLAYSFTQTASYSPANSQNFRKFRASAAPKKTCVHFKHVVGNVGRCLVRFVLVKPASYDGYWKTISKLDEIILASLILRCTLYFSCSWRYRFAVKKIISRPSTANGVAPTKKHKTIYPLCLLVRLPNNTEPVHLTNAELP